MRASSDNKKQRGMAHTDTKLSGGAEGGIGYNTVGIITGIRVDGMHIVDSLHAEGQ